MLKIEREAILCRDSSSIDMIAKFTFDGSQVSWSEESRHTIASRSIFDITMSNISSALWKDTLTARLVSDINVHGIKPAHNPTIPDTPLPTPNISEITQERHQKLTPEYIAQKWNIGLNTANNTIKVTTQLGFRSALVPLTRHYCTDTIQQNHMLV